RLPRSCCCRSATSCRWPTATSLTRPGHPRPPGVDQFVGSARAHVEAHRLAAFPGRDLDLR
ncbi:MAG: hypothetical protein ACRYG2_11570, partial [Janthinobacterium lividum]